MCAVGSDRKQEHLQQDLEDPPLSLEQLHFSQSPTLPTIPPSSCQATLSVVLLHSPVCMWEASPWEASPWESSPWEASPCLAQKLLPMLMAHLC